MLDPRGGLAITYNGEIYNFIELREELIKRGHLFQTGTDTEVVLSSYREWGPGCLSWLNGMFAFAVWDEKSGHLFLARDRFGEKPLFYHQNSDTFTFASEAKALFACPWVPREPDETGVLRFLASDTLESGEQTLFRGIRRVPAAHYGTVRPGGALELKRYWELRPSGETRKMDETDYAEAFRIHLREAVRIRLRSDVPVGSSLSGGLDSSSIVCLTAELAGGCPEGKDADTLGSVATRNTFSARFPGSAIDEGSYIDEVVRATGVQARYTIPSPEGLREEIDQLIWHQEEPFSTTSIFAQWSVMKLARESGVTVLLDGQGADEILAGYHGFFLPFWVELLSGGEVRDLLREILTYVKIYRGYDLGGPREAASGWNSSFSSFPGFDLAGRAIRRLLRPPVPSWVLVPSGFSPADRDPDAGSSPFPDRLHQSLYRALTKTGLPTLLRYADRNSMAFGREVRLPFLDHRLVEFAFACPAEQKLRNGMTKVLLRSAMRGILPEGVRTRVDKIGFQTPEDRWLRGPLSSWINEILQSPSLGHRGYVDQGRVMKLWRRFLAGDNTARPVIWRTVITELWCRRFFDQ